MPSLERAPIQRKRTSSLTIRLTLHEKELLLSKAAERNMSTTDYILWCSTHENSNNYRPVLKCLKQIKDILSEKMHDDRDNEQYPDLLDITNEVYNMVMTAIRTKKDDRNE